MIDAIQLIIIANGGIWQLVGVATRRAGRALIPMSRGLRYKVRTLIKARARAPAGRSRSKGWHVTVVNVIGTSSTCPKQLDA